MAACTADSAEAGPAPSGGRRGAWVCGKAERSRAPQAARRQAGAAQSGRAAGERGKLPAVPEPSAAGDGDGGARPMDRGPEGPRESGSPGIPAASPGAGAEKEEQREEEEEEEEACSLGGGGAAGRRSVTGSRRDDGAAGAQMSPSLSSSSSSSSASSGGDPPPRRGSEDSTLMEVESTVSSGRSTPAMLTAVLGGPIPVTNPASSAKGPAYPCCWDRCLESFCSSPDLAEHIRSAHADSQSGGMYVCLWKGCKVYNTPSSSPSWLQRHLLSHSGDKPFKCVVAGCSASFASQGGVARHVPSHFSQQNSSKLSGQPRAKEESPSKASIRKRRLRARHHRSLPRPHDFFDAQTMDAIRHRAICLNLATHIESLGHGHSVVFHSTVIARRKENSGKVKVLLHWSPEDILPDAWVSESDRPQLKTKVVHLSQLPQDTGLLLDPKTYRMFL